jgi:hypothetical protein
MVGSGGAVVLEQNNWQKRMEKRTRIGDSNGQEFVENIADNFYCVTASLVADRVFNKKATACESGGPSNFGVIIFEVG